MLWFFQGLERMRLASALEIGGKVLATLSIFVLVHKPDDGWKVMAAQCVGCVVAHGVTVVLAYREVGFRWPTPSSVWNALRLGGSMFLFRVVQGLSGSVNRLVLGAVAPVAVLGEYAGAERITRVFQQGMWPVNQALYPKLTQQTQNDPEGAMKTVRLSLLFLGGLGLVFGAGHLSWGSAAGATWCWASLPRRSAGAARLLSLDPANRSLYRGHVSVAVAQPTGQPVQLRKFHRCTGEHPGRVVARSSVRRCRHCMVGRRRADVHSVGLRGRPMACRVEPFVIVYGYRCSPAFLGIGADTGSCHRNPA